MGGPGSGNFNHPGYSDGDRMDKGGNASGKMSTKEILKNVPREGVRDKNLEKVFANHLKNNPDQAEWYQRKAEEERSKADVAKRAARDEARAEKAHARDYEKLKQKQRNYPRD